MIFSQLIHYWQDRNAPSEYVIGHRREPEADDINWWELTPAVSSEPVFVKKYARVLVVARRTASTKAVIKMLRRDELCYVKYGNELKHFISALGSFDHYLLGPHIDLVDQESIRMIVRRTNLDLSRIAFLPPATFLHWSGKQEAAIFEPLKKAARIRIKASHPIQTDEISEFE